MIVSLRGSPFNSWMLRMVSWISFQMSSSCLLPVWTSGWLRKLSRCRIREKEVVSSLVLTCVHNFCAISRRDSGIFPLRVNINYAKLMRPVPSLSNNWNTLLHSVGVISIRCALMTWVNYSGFNRVSWSLSACFNARYNCRKPRVPLEAKRFLIRRMTDSKTFSLLLLTNYWP